MDKKVDLLDQLKPDYGYDEHGNWNGMSRSEVETKLAKMKRMLEEKQLAAWRLDQLVHWTPRSLPN